MFRWLCPTPRARFFAMNKTVRKGSSARPESELHARIRTKGILIGCGIESLHPATTELAGMVGFDLVWGDLEHGAASPHQVEMFCIAAKAGGAWPLVRVSFTERAHIMRALEAGARLIAVPMVENAATARRIVEFGKYRPTGNRGFAASTCVACSTGWEARWPTSTGPTGRPIFFPR